MSLAEPSSSLGAPGSSPAIPSDPAARLGGWLMILGLAVMTAGVAVSSALGNIGFITALAGALLARAPLHRAPGFWWGVAFSAWLGVSLAAGWQRAGASTEARFGVWYLWLAFPVAWCALADLRGARWGLRLAVATAGVAALLGALQFIIGLDRTSPPLRIAHDGSPERLHVFGQGFHSTHLHFGAVMMLLTVGFASAKVRALVGRGWAWSGFAIAGGGLLVSGARLAWLGMVAGIAALVGVASRRRLLWGAGTALALLAGFLLLLRATDPVRFAKMTAGDDGRWMVWRTSAHILAEHPVTGTGGAKAFSTRYAELNPQLHGGATGEFPMGAPHAHNTLLALAAQYGLPAALLYLGMLGAVLLAAWRRRAADRPGWCLAAATVAAVLMAGMLEYVAAQSVVAQLQAVLLAVALAANHPRAAGE